jgi:hypothetical protein
MLSGSSSCAPFLAQSATFPAQGPTESAAWAPRCPIGSSAPSVVSFVSKVVKSIGTASIAATVSVPVWRQRDVVAAEVILDAHDDVPPTRRRNLLRLFCGASTVCTGFTQCAVPVIFGALSSAVPGSESTTIVGTARD